MFFFLDDYSHGGYESSEGSDDCSLEVSYLSMPEDICYGDQNLNRNYTKESKTKLYIFIAV